MSPNNMTFRSLPERRGENMWQFMSDSPWLAFFLALIIGEVIVRVFVNLPNRIMRHWNIHKHGYPPVHCDADGDFRPAGKRKEG